MGAQVSKSKIDPASDKSKGDSLKIEQIVCNENDNIAIHDSLRICGGGGVGKHRKHLSYCSVATKSPSFQLDLKKGSSRMSIEVEAEPKCEFIDAIIDKLINSDRATNKIISSKEITQVCQLAKEILEKQPALLRLDPPVNIVGDIHGQFNDLIDIFEFCGFPSTQKYLFLGDYVDRGKKSIETILLVLCYKIKYPERFFILRGNHESASINRIYGFYDECKRKYSVKLWKTFTDVFNVFPIAAIVAKKIFCVHGGLSPSLQELKQINLIRRPTEIPDHGLLSDLLWSDPCASCDDWEESDRGVSYKFGASIVKKFLKKHNLDLICRAHMVVEDGYEFFAQRSLVTIFSAPNYCNEFDNKGAVLQVDKNLICSFAFPSSSKSDE